ncbi:MAG TPA: heavy metal-binding domain-containing protein, partial [Blastocatellia bacterium]
MVRKLMLALLVAVIAPGFFGELTESAPALVEGYVCPPCGCGDDDKIHDKPGVCASCGMQLVPKGGAAASSVMDEPQNRKKAAILIFDGV